eukprot:m.310427 g.310427  ORF g.310427 m.310427 type:complete len:487 (-) comp20209_c0_seq6:181-1641(-)
MYSMRCLSRCITMYRQVVLVVMVAASHRVISAAGLIRPSRSVQPSQPSGNAIALQARINEAAENSCGGDSQRQQVDVAPGEYMFGNSSLLVSNACNIDIVISSTGIPLTRTVASESHARFWFFIGFGVEFTNCINVSVHGDVLTIDSDGPNYAQGVVVAAPTAEAHPETSERMQSNTIIVEFDTDFLDPDTSATPFDSPGGVSGAKVAFWDPDVRQLIQFVNKSAAAVGNQFMNASKQLNTADGRNVWAISLKSPPRWIPIVNRTLVTVFPRRGITWSKRNCTNLTTENVHIYAGGNMGFFESLGGGGNVYRNVFIGRPPAGYDTRPHRLLGLNADGFHSSDVGTGPVLQDSEISFTGDDFLNVHNKMQVICMRHASNKLIIIDSSAGALALGRAGDTLRFYHLNSLEHVGTGLVFISLFFCSSSLSIVLHCHKRVSLGLLRFWWFLFVVCGRHQKSRGSGSWCNSYRFAVKSLYFSFLRLVQHER